MKNKISEQDKESESTSVLKTTFVTKEQTAALMKELDLEELNLVSGGHCSKTCWLYWCQIKVDQTVPESTDPQITLTSNPMGSDGNVLKGGTAKKP